MKIYERFDYLAYWFRYQATYLEMKYHLEMVIKGKESCYIKRIGHYDRNIGKTTALARLSAKYDIPVIVPNSSWEILINESVVRYLPKYFKKRKPRAYVAGLDIKGLTKNIVLIEEGLSDEQIDVATQICSGKLVGFSD